MKKTKNANGQANKISELEDRLNYLELKQNGAIVEYEGSLGIYKTKLKYIWVNKIKTTEICGYYSIRKETDEYIILRECVTDKYYILSKNNEEIYDKGVLEFKINNLKELRKALDDFNNKEQSKREKRGIK